MKNRQPDYTNVQKVMGKLFQYQKGLEQKNKVKPTVGSSTLILDGKSVEKIVSAWVSCKLQGKNLKTMEFIRYRDGGEKIKCIT